MAEPFPREMLQPSLLDRLQDDLASALNRLPARRAALDLLLDPTQRAALQRLLDDERRLEGRRPTPTELAPFAGLTAEAKDLLDDVLGLELARRLELRRSVVLTMADLRAAVLRDLASLLNSEQAEQLTTMEDGEPVPLLAGLPNVCASVVNYGIPSLAGRVRTTADYELLAREVETALQRFEPRLREVHVRLDGHEADLAVRSPVTLLIEGELWGYPVAEALRVRTLLDLEEGRAHVDATGAG